jgi:hypothetical protein
VTFGALGCNPVRCQLEPIIFTLLRQQFDFLDCGSPAAAFSYASLLASPGGGAAKLSLTRGRKINIPSRQQGCPSPERQQAAAIQGLRLGGSFLKKGF